MPRRLLSALSLLLAVGPAPGHEGGLGLFTEHTDIGAPKRAGTVAHDATTGAYVVGGGGANMWFAKDSFHFVWKKAEGDLALAADIAFEGTGGNPHRKAVLMIRQSLDADSAYVDVALHGDGLASLQFREQAGAVTHEVQVPDKAPGHVRLDKIGDYVYLSLVGEHGLLRPTGSSARVAFKPPFYIGLGVCAHDDTAFARAVFSNVRSGAPSEKAATVRSSLEYIKVPSGDRVCVNASDGLIDAVEWTADDVWRFTVDAAAVSLPASAGATRPAALPAAVPGVSPDGKWLAVLEHQGDTAVLILRPAAGGDARELMRLPDQASAPRSIAWSPDSTKIAYVRHQPGPKH